MSLFTVKRKVPYGSAVVAIDHVPYKGEQIDVYVPSVKLLVGDTVTISPPGFERKGKVVEDHGQNPKFNTTCTGGKQINTGRNMYKIEVID